MERNRPGASKMVDTAETGEWSEELARCYCEGMEANVKYDHRPCARRIAADLSTCRPGLTAPVVLDVAAGPAFLLLELAPHLPGARLLANDSAPVMLDLAVERARARGLEVEPLLCPAEGLTLADQSVDVVICKHYLRLSPDPLRLLEECHRVLGPDGVLYLVDFNGEASKLKARVLWTWIRVMNSKKLAQEFWESFAGGYPVSSVPPRCVAAGFASATVLRRGLSYLVRATRVG